MVLPGVLTHTRSFHTRINRVEVVKLDTFSRAETEGDGGLLAALTSRREWKLQTLWNLWGKAHGDVLKVRLKCILWAINCQHELKCEPVFSIKLPCALNGDKVGFYCVWGCWLLASTSAGRWETEWKSDIIIIKIENRDTSSRETLCVCELLGRKRQAEVFLIKNKTSLRPPSFTKLNFSEISLVDWCQRSTLIISISIHMARHLFHPIWKLFNWATNVFSPYRQLRFAACHVHSNEKQ